MSLSAYIASAQALCGREAAAQAANRALELAGRAPIGLGIVVVSPEYALQQVLSGLHVLLGETPLWGFTAATPLTGEGRLPRSLSLALLSGDFTARAEWTPGYTQNSRAAAISLANALAVSPSAVCLLAADGAAGDAEALADAWAARGKALAGCLASGLGGVGQSGQIGGLQGGLGGLAGATLEGSLAAGVGSAHGWQAVGAYFRVTRSAGTIIAELDGLPAAEAISQWLGYNAREWAAPPLNRLIRLYPLGIETEGAAGLVVRAPLEVQADGSLRMNASVAEGSIAHLMSGSMDGCLRAASRAASQALAQLGGAPPALAILLADEAVEKALTNQPGAEIEAMRAVIGPQTPIIGGYGFGQLCAAGQRSVVLNGHIQIMLLG